MVGGPQSRSGHGGEEKDYQPLLRLEHPIIQPVAQSHIIQLPRLLTSNKIVSNFWKKISFYAKKDL
jgi:hypothetical protein